MPGPQVWEEAPCSPQIRSLVPQVLGEPHCQEAPLGVCHGHSESSRNPCTAVTVRPWGRGRWTCCRLQNTVQPAAMSAAWHWAMSAPGLETAQSPLGLALHQRKGAGKPGGGSCSGLSQHFPHLGLEKQGGSPLQLWAPERHSPPHPRSLCF